MSEHHEEKRAEEGIEKQKILIGESSLICFACGEKINLKTEKCPNCNTEQKY